MGDGMGSPQSHMQLYEPSLLNYLIPVDHLTYCYCWGCPDTTTDDVMSDFTGTLLKIE
jgi:hypothetical protein